MTTLAEYAATILFSGVLGASLAWLVACTFYHDRILDAWDNGHAVGLSEQEGSGLIVEPVRRRPYDWENTP